MRKYGLETTGDIHRWAKAAGFTRDVSGYVREAAQWKLLGLSPDTVEGDVIGAATERTAEQHATVIRRHRKVSGELREAVEGLAGLAKDYVQWAVGASFMGLDENTPTPPFLPTGPKESPSAFIYSVTSSLEKLVRLERQAYQIKDEEEGVGIKAEDLVLSADPDE